MDLNPLPIVQQQKTLQIELIKPIMSFFYIQVSFIKIHRHWHLLDMICFVLVHLKKKKKKKKELYLFILLILLKCSIINANNLREVSKLLLKIRTQMRFSWRLPWWLCIFSIGEEEKKRGIPHLIKLCFLNK